MKKLLILVACTLGFASVSHAGAMIEPYLGYEMGKMSTPDGKTEMTNAGLRLAYRLPILLWFGLDGTTTLNGRNVPDSGANADIKRTTIYGVAGIDLPILLRGWVGYGFSDELKISDTTDTKIKANNMKVGIGFTGLPFISLNVEYIKENVTSVDKNDGTNPNTSYDSYMVSVSLPLNF